MRNRLLYGSLLALMAGGVFWGDQVAGPPFPFLLALAAVLTGMGSFEFASLMPAETRLRPLLLAAGNVALISTPWLMRSLGRPLVDTLAALAVDFALLVAITFLLAMTRFSPGGRSTELVANSTLGLAYIGLAGALFVVLRLFAIDPATGTAWLVLAVFVPKGCDIGAYFTGRAFGRTKMSPVLSPNKTWEGAIGGLGLAAAIAAAINACVAVIPGGLPGAACFGLTIGAAGMLGDLAESMIKRDAGAKDASHLIPGFGGILDVVDAVLFSAPFVLIWAFASGTLGVSA
jgi:phosphatidate cytidylyltransferase